MKKPIPILLSEKVILASQAYSLSRDPFVGLILAHLNANISLSVLNQAFKKTLTAHTSFRILFKKQDHTFKKEIGPLVFPDIKFFSNKASFLLFKEGDLPPEFLYQTAVYKTLFKKILLFKFHHLIMDGLSLAYFFQDLTKNYYDLLSADTSNHEPAHSDKINRNLDIKSDKSLANIDKRGFSSSERDKASKSQVNTEKIPLEREIYHKVLQDFSFKEKQDRDKKIAFWKQKLQNFKKNSPPQPCDKEGNFPLVLQKQAEINSKESFFCVSLSRFSLKKLAKSQEKNQIKEPYLLFSAYSKALQECFQISALVLRTAFSARHELKNKDEKRLIASLSRSVPLFIPNSRLSLGDQALEFQTQAREARDFLVIDKFPIPFNELKSYSKVKNQHLSLSMSYFYYDEKQFLARIKSFCWQGFFQDIVLFIILSQKNLLLNFTYNPHKFSKKEIKNLYRNFEKQIQKMNS